MNVLFIEDEKDLSQSGVLQMQALGCKVTPAYDLAEARALLESDQTFQLVIADHRLPDGLGIQFIAGVKADYPKVRFVVVSGCLSDEDMERMKALDIPAYRKPLLYSQVVNTLRRDLAMRAPVKVLEPDFESQFEVPAQKKKKFLGLF